MAFHFKKKESLTKAVRRLSRERLGKALAHLQKCDRLEAVHSVRKEIKKVRATLGLVREKMDGDTYRKYTKTLRVVAKHLRDARDVHVRPRTLKQLTVHFKGRLPARPFVEIKKALRQNCGEETREFLKGKSVATVDRLLRKINRRARSLKVRAEGWMAILSGLRKSYSRGRKAFELVCGEASPENFHQWRKHVQDLWHQLRLLCPSQPNNLRVAIGKLKTLSQLLGADHDLVMLQQFVTRRCARRHPGEVRLLNKLIDLRHKELRSAALVLGSRSYAEKPSPFCRRIENYWRAWRAGKKSRN